MSVELKIPEVGESVTEAVITRWFKSVGDYVAQDEPIAELETDKVTVEMPCPASGVLTEIRTEEGDVAKVGEVIAVVDDQAEAPEPSAKEASAAPNKAAQREAAPKRASTKEKQDGKPRESPPAKAADEPTADQGGAQASQTESETARADREVVRVMPAARRLLEQHDLEASEVAASGPGGRLLKEDVEAHLAAQSSDEQEARAPGDAKAREETSFRHETLLPISRDEERVPMSPIRRRIAERLVSAQQNAALLTTFNEIDMSAVIDARNRYKDAFAKRHGIKLGFMSFFVKASVDALRLFPQINAEIQDTEIVYKNYFDIGIAVSTDRGLLVPVLRNAERLGFADIEKQIADFGERARAGKIRLEELQGGTFTISNGGIFGSMLSTPLINPPQSGVLGLHAIEERPIAHQGQVVVHPMMYVALTYDHRIVDGREAVTFLRRIKETVEDPARMLLEV